MESRSREVIRKEPAVAITEEQERARSETGEREEQRQQQKYQRRWSILAVLFVSLLIIIVDDTIVNVAIPTLQRELGASTTRLQWIVDANILAFAGLLLTMGTLGDRFCRKRFLHLGVVGVRGGQRQPITPAAADLSGVGSVKARGVDKR
jgi:uncharacterized ion transporter superfamily protein YfcC